MIADDRVRAEFGKSVHAHRIAQHQGRMKTGGGRKNRFEADRLPFRARGPSLVARCDWQAVNPGGEIEIHLEIVMQ